MEANAMLSSLISIDESAPLFFPTIEHKLNCSFLLIQSQDKLLLTLQHLDTIGVINTLNSNPSAYTFKCQDTVIFLQARQIDGEGRLRNPLQIH